MGATRFSEVVGQQSAHQANPAELRPPQAFSKFPGDRYHLRVSGIDFGSTSVMSVQVTEGHAPGRTLQQHPGGLVCTFMLEGRIVIDDGARSPVTIEPGSCCAYGGSTDVNVTWGPAGRAVVAIVPHQVVRDFGMVPSGGLTLLPEGSTLLEPTPGTGSERLPAASAA